MANSYVDIIFEAAQTIVGATTPKGICRKKAERIEDPKGFFRGAKAPYLKK